MPSKEFIEETQIFCSDTKEICNGYREYLLSNHWKGIRERLINKNAYCASCKSEVALQLHHLTYQNLGSEKQEDLLVLCVDCHKKLHQGKKLKGIGRKPRNKRKPKVVGETRLKSENVFNDLKKARGKYYDWSCKYCIKDGEYNFCSLGYKFCPFKKCLEYKAKK